MNSVQTKAYCVIALKSNLIVKAMLDKYFQEMDKGDHDSPALNPTNIRERFVHHYTNAREKSVMELM